MPDNQEKCASDNEAILTAIMSSSICVQLKEKNCHICELDGGGFVKQSMIPFIQLKLAHDQMKLKVVERMK
jgi:hypothetical protein